MTEETGRDRGRVAAAWSSLPCCRGQFAMLQLTLRHAVIMSNTIELPATRRDFNCGDATRILNAWPVSLTCLLGGLAKTRGKGSIVL